MLQGKLSLVLLLAYSHFDIYLILGILSNNTYTDTMNRRHASSSFSTPEPKRQDLPLYIIADDLNDLFDGGPLSPLTPPEISSDEVSDEEVPHGLKWCQQANHGWMLLGKDKDEFSGISWKSMLIDY